MSATAAAEEVLDARAAALDESGWGRRMRVWQPRNLALWVYLLLVVGGAALLGSYFVAESAVYGPAIMVAVVLFSLYAALFWWFTVHIDRYAGLPVTAVVLAFVWGATAAVGAMASNANTPLISLFGKWFGSSWALDWGAGVAAPLDEELAKGAGVLLLLVLARKVVRTAFDGFVLGAFSGLGFQTVEDLTYALGSASRQFGANQVANAVQVIELRMETGFFGHILYSAVFGAGLIWFLGTPAEPRRRLRGLGAMLAAMILHGLWDSAAGVVGSLGLGGAGVIGYWVLVAVLAVAVVITVFRLAIPRERGYMRAVMAPEVATGTLTQEELDTLAGDGSTRRRYRRAAHGHERRRRHHRLVAGHDLADELARAAGRDTPRVEHARSELARFAAKA